MRSGKGSWQSGFLNRNLHPAFEPLSMRDFTATHTLAKSSATRDLILKAEFPAFIHVGLRLGIISQDLVGNATVVIGSGMVRF